MTRERDWYWIGDLVVDLYGVVGIRKSKRRNIYTVFLADGTALENVLIEPESLQEFLVALGIEGDFE